MKGGCGSFRSWVVGCDEVVREWSWRASERLESDARCSMHEIIRRHLEFHPRHTTHNQLMPPVQNWTERHPVETAVALPLCATAKSARRYRHATLARLQFDSSSRILHMR